MRELATADVVAFGGVGIAGQLLPDRSEFTTFSGCLMDRATPGEYAAAHLDQG